MSHLDYDRSIRMIPAAPAREQNREHGGLARLGASLGVRLGRLLAGWRRAVPVRRVVPPTEWTAE